ncbi:hypothetical protein [Providencia rettgeri]|uniref:hypothetical protein n=1 Tax=Providencia rettgeri TaxID=587 RepID=UPI0024AA25E8
MGLDMYFYANEKAEADENRIPASLNDEPEGNIDAEVGYFRKVNALFKWVEDHIGAIENCEKLPVTQAHLLALQRDLQALTPENCHTVFPTQGGFFFGSTDYDDGYWEDVNDVKRWLDEMFDSFDFDQFSLHFLAWW